MNNTIQYTGFNDSYLREWSNHRIISSPVLEPTKENPSGKYVQIKLLNGEIITAIVGQWIVRDNDDFKVLTEDEYKKSDYNKKYAITRIKEPVFQYLGIDGDCHLLKVSFPVVEKIKGKFEFIADKEANTENVIGNYGAILRLKPDNLWFFNKDSSFIQMEIKIK